MFKEIVLANSRRKEIYNIIKKSWITFERASKKITDSSFIPRASY
jgi:hypothetical protein